jgi:hypothetical protein
VVSDIILDGEEDGAAIVAALDDVQRLVGRKYRPSRAIEALLPDRRCVTVATPGGARQEILL